MEKIQDRDRWALQKNYNHGVQRQNYRIHGTTRKRGILQPTKL